MTVDYTITTARLEDLPHVPAIELAAARLLAGHAPDSVLAETTSLEELVEAQRDGHLWVALVDEVPVGYAHVKVLEPAAVHLEEIDVLPEHGRRGIGAGLVTAICSWAADAGYRSVTLTTFRDVSFNGPFYARLGFEEIPYDQIGPRLREVMEDETRRGLDPSRRIAMRRRLTPATS